MAKAHPISRKKVDTRLRKVLIATALPLEREEVMKHLEPGVYDAELYADVCQWPKKTPVFEIYVLATGPGNLVAQGAVLRVLNKAKPKFAFFLGVCGGVKDSEIGDVVYGTKVYYVEGGKEEEGGFKFRPVSARTSEDLIQLAHRVAKTDWQPQTRAPTANKPEARPAVIASGEKVLASTGDEAVNFIRLKAGYNDTQVIDMEAFGFLAALETHKVSHQMIVRGVSDKLKDKASSDSAGNQPLAAKNAAAFLFALLRLCENLLPKKKKKRFSLFGKQEKLPDHLL